MNVVGKNVVVRPEHQSASPRIEDLLGPGETRIAVERGSDSPWIEVEIVDEGAVTRERRQAVFLSSNTIVWITAAATIERSRCTFALADLIASSVVAVIPEGKPGLLVRWLALE